MALESVKNVFKYVNTLKEGTDPAKCNLWLSNLLIICFKYVNTLKEGLIRLSVTYGSLIYIKNMFQVCQYSERGD